MSVSNASSMMRARPQMDFSALREKLFNKADKNKDAALSLEEFISAGKKVQGGTNGTDDTKAKELFAKIDSDGNGSLSKDEVKAFDDKMSKDMQAAMTQLQELMGQMQGAFGHPPKPPKLSDAFDKIDADTSGGISKSEFAEFSKMVPKRGSDTNKTDEIFTKIDTNGDQSLSKDEITAFETTLEAEHKAKAGSSSDVQLSILMDAMNAYGKSSKNAKNKTNDALSAFKLAMR